MGNKDVSVEKLEKVGDTGTMSRFVNALSVVLGGIIGAVLADSASTHLAGEDAPGADFVKMLVIPVGFVPGAVAGRMGASGARRHLAREMQVASKQAKGFYLGGIALGVIGIGIVCSDLMPRPLELPPDRALLADFERNRGTLEHLAAMVKADKGIEAVDDTSYRFRGKEALGMRTERINSYRERLRAAQVTNGVRLAWDKQGVEFRCRVVDCSWSGLYSTKTKGYLYSERTPDPLVPTLDNADARTAYRHITGNWYLYYDHFVE